jgi:hypothetical protein
LTYEGEIQDINAAAFKYNEIQIKKRVVMKLRIFVKEIN